MLTKNGSSREIISNRLTEFYSAYKMHYLVNFNENFYKKCIDFEKENIPK